MSIYATLLEFSQEDGEAVITDGEGNVATVGDDSSAAPHTAPYTYHGSNKTAHPDARSGALSLSETVPWCSEKPFLRVSAAEDDREPTVLLLDFDQVQQLAETLNNWVSDVRSGDWRKRGDHEVTNSSLFEHYIPTI